MTRRCHWSLIAGPLFGIWATTISAAAVPAGVDLTDEPLLSGSVQTDRSPPPAQVAGVGVGRRSHRAGGAGTVPQGRSAALADRYARRRYRRHPRDRDAASRGLSRHPFIVTDHDVGGLATDGGQSGVVAAPTGTPSQPNRVLGLALHCSKRDGSTRFPPGSTAPARRSRVGPRADSYSRPSSSKCVRSSGVASQRYPLAWFVGGAPKSTRSLWREQRRCRRSEAASPSK